MIKQKFRDHSNCIGIYIGIAPETVISNQDIEKATRSSRMVFGLDMQIAVASYPTKKNGSGRAWLQAIEFFIFFRVVAVFKVQISC